MKAEFWLAAWERSETGFHLPRVNPYLQKFWPDLALPPGSRVFVPLCGKSLDMVWLAENGHPVVGIELSPLAVHQFFSENGLDYRRHVDPHFDRYDGGDVTILNGDFFDLTPPDLAEVVAAYDRAALVAMPPELRSPYAGHLAKLLPIGARVLLITFDYPQEMMAGPPFSVPAAEVEQLFSPSFTIDHLASRDILEKSSRMARGGLTRFNQEMFLLERR